MSFLVFYMSFEVGERLGFGITLVLVVEVAKQTIQVPCARPRSRLGIIRTRATRVLPPMRRRSPRTCVHASRTA
eukprot:6277517-Prymnesium_polylepis.1